MFFIERNKDELNQFNQINNFFQCSVENCLTIEKVKIYIRLRYVYSLY